MPAPCLVASGCDFPDPREDPGKIEARAHEYRGRVLAEGAEVRGYNEGHVGVLAIEEVEKLSNQLLSREEAQR